MRTPINHVQPFKHGIAISQGKSARDHFYWHSLSAIMSWTGTYIPQFYVKCNHSSMPYFNCDLTKLLFQLGRGWVITYHNYYGLHLSYLKFSAGLVNLCYWKSRLYGSDKLCILLYTTYCCSFHAVFFVDFQYSIYAYVWDSWLYTVR